MKIIQKLVILVLINLTVLLSPIKAGELNQSISYSDLIDQYRDIIKIEMVKNKIAGISIALVSENEVIWNESFGYENLEDSIKATGKSIYGIGSVTKVFTASAILQQVENGTFKLDEPISKYAPELSIKHLPGNEGQITLRMLLSHHAGFPSDLLGLNIGKENYKSVVN